jgi:hypothetical protein
MGFDAVLMSETPPWALAYTSLTMPIFSLVETHA